MSHLRREKYLLTLGVCRVLDDNYAALVRRILQMNVTNMRNRPVSTSHIDTMFESILSLYHNLATGSKDFPSISFQGFLDSYLMETPFPYVGQSETENATPSPLMDQPAGVMVPTAGSSSSPPKILTAVHPEKMELGALIADGRNCVRTMEFDGTSVIRVISTVYRTDSTELTNCWRLSDYNTDGGMLMSVLCQFTSKSAKCAQPLREGKRKDTEEDGSSSLAPARKWLRV